jgi:protein-arginine kinase activator protein McsA
MTTGDRQCDDACERTMAMITDRELWGCANHYVSQHGDDAPIIAAMRADELLAQGDLDCSRTFQSIVRRIKLLLEGPTGRLN